MASMKLAGAEVNLQFTESFKEMAEDEMFEQAQNDRMLKQMETTWDDIETNNQTIGFDSLSLEVYRQELQMELKKNQKHYQSMPRGIYTGFKAIQEVCPQPGIIALLGYPTRPPKTVNFTYKGHELIYINGKGDSVLVNQKEVLDAIAKHKECLRDNDGLRAIDQGDEKSIHAMGVSLNQWVMKQAVEEEVLEDGTIKQRMGAAQMDLISKLQAGSRQAVETLKTADNPAEKFKPENFDLIAWFVVNK
jgi:hypothetical protein